MKLTQPKKVTDIVHPPILGLAESPAVELSEPVMRAIEMMLQYDLKLIAVTRDGRLVGHVRLAEALKFLGIRIPPGSSHA